MSEILIKVVNLPGKNTVGTDRIERRVKSVRKGEKEVAAMIDCDSEGRMRPGSRAVWYRQFGHSRSLSSVQIWRVAGKW